MYNRDQDRLHLKDKRSSYMLTALSLTQASTAPCREVSLEPIFLPVGREPGDNQVLSASWVTLQKPLLRSHIMGLQGNLEASTTVNMTMMVDWRQEWGGGCGCNNQHKGLGR